MTTTETPSNITSRPQPATDSRPGSNIILIGMAGSGKTTIGKALAHRLGLAHVDTDHLLEAWWGIQLQQLRDRLGLEGFLEAEKKCVQGLILEDCVISTGGSVVYRAEAMRALQALGPIIGLTAGFPAIAERIARNPHRGLAIAEGQTLEDLYRERQDLYQSWSDLCIATDTHPIAACVQTIEEWLHGQKEGPAERI